jgi:biotin carboxyl carrier protein
VERICTEILEVKFEARIGEKSFEVSIIALPTANGSERLAITLKDTEGERSCKVELLGQQKDRWTFKVENAVEDFIVSRNDLDTLVDWNCRLYPIQILRSNQRRPQPVGSPQLDEETAVCAQMPGKIVRVLRSAGDRVEQAEGVVVVEAMKMQNEISSPRKGRVVHCNLREGDSVKAGDVLFKIL